MRRADSILKIQTPLTEQEISGITDHIDHVRPGFVFFAIVGSQVDGHQWAQTAIDRGAPFVVTQNDLKNIPHLRVVDTRAAYASACARWENHPSHSLKIVATTGTSGKTTTTYLIHSLLEALDLAPGLLSTIENDDGKTRQSSSLTTLDPASLQKFLRSAVENGRQSIAMEASSHSIHQNRIGGIAFDSLVFINLSAEHLDYHQTLDGYFEAKAELFRSFLLESVRVKEKVHVALPVDEPYGQRLLKELREKKNPKIEITLYGDDAETQTLEGEFFVYLRHPHFSLKGLRSLVHVGRKGGSFETIEIQSELVGFFNAQNMAAAIASVRGWVTDISKLKLGIQNLKSVPGRLEKVASVKGRHIFVDYAHKPDALEKVLKTLKDLEPKWKRITVFGCGGNRDAFKRPRMGEIAARLSDQVWITTDNSRDEEPAEIIRQIEEGIPQKARSKVKIQPDRRQAIEEAILQAPPDSFVLIAGKGHETTQIVKGSKSLFSDKKEAIRAAARLDSQN